MAASHDHAILDFYPGTFYARTTQSFKDIYWNIHDRVSDRLSRDYGSPPVVLSVQDAIDLLSGHSAYIHFKKNKLRVVHLPREWWIDEKTRLLLMDMAAGVETPYVIDRLSRMAQTWVTLSHLSTRHMILVNAGASRGAWLDSCSNTADVPSCVHTDYFVSIVLVRNMTSRRDPAVFGDVCVDVCDAAQYALMRADFEPMLPEEYGEYVLRVRVGMRTCVAAISRADAELLLEDGMASAVADIPDDVFAVRLVPASVRR